jgi:hypothetical protein
MTHVSRIDLDRQILHVTAVGRWADEKPHFMSCTN